VAKKEKTKKGCFAVTPIGEEGSEIRRRSDQVLKYIIEPVMAELGYETVRADRISQPGLITHQVIEHLIDDELVVADLTGSNPNVFYELAIRHATRKPIVIMIEAGERIPFDVNQSRVIQFTYKDLDSVDACKKELERQVKTLEVNPANFFTPVSVSIDLKAMHESDNPEERRDAQVLAALEEIRAETSQLGAEVARLRSYVDRIASSSLYLSTAPTLSTVRTSEPWLVRTSEPWLTANEPTEPLSRSIVTGDYVPSVSIGPQLSQIDKTIIDKTISDYTRRHLAQAREENVDPGTS
jgi:hypothetical protein